MNKKNLWSLLAIMVVTLFSISLGSCCKDDDNAGGNKTNNNTQETTLKQQLLGTWYVVWESEIQGYTFNADGTAIGYEGKLNAPTPRGEQYDCHYTLVGNTLTITEDGDGDTDVYTITYNADGTMTFRDSKGDTDIYTRLPEDKTPYQLLLEIAAGNQ